MSHKANSQKWLSLASVFYIFHITHVLCAPSHIHIAFAGSNGMRIMWATTHEATSTVKWSLHHPEELQTTTNPDGPVPFRNHFIHDVKLSDLEPATEYSYQCGDEIDGFSEFHIFKTALPPGDKTSFDVAVVGDVGTGETSGKVTTDALVSELDSYEFVWHMGDIGYADDFYLFPDGIGNFDSYADIMNEYLTRITPISRTKPYMPMPGNHEQLCAEVVPEDFCTGTESNFSYYRHIFHPPYEESGSDTMMWYSFDYGLVHFVSLNTESDFPNSPTDESVHDFFQPAGPFGDQMTWLENDLKAAHANRENVPWIFVGGHRPPYTTCSACRCHACREAFEPLFDEYSVDIGIFGHGHSYERMWQIVNDEPIKTYEGITATVYIMNGAGGNVEGHQSLGTPLKDYSAFHNYHDWGFGHLTVINETHIRWQWKKSETLEVADEQYITKSMLEHEQTFEESSAQKFNVILLIESFLIYLIFIYM